MRQKIDCVRFYAVIFLLLISTGVFAQKQVAGTITNAKDNTPVGFATVTVKGTNVAALSNADGSFVITLPPGKTTLIISSVGFDDAEVSAATGNVTVSLKEKTSSLDEIVVTGYTAQKKKTLTGSVAVVNVKELKEIPAGSPEQMLQGKASGVSIVSPGQPGTESSIRIRGITSFGNTNPLVIIDGVPGSLRDINANDIESLQILKDAAAAIYGVRGSNGVIVITTRKGKGRATISYDGYYGTQQVPKGNVFNLLNPTEMADLVWLAQKNSGIDTPSHPQYGTGINPRLPDYILVGGTSGFIGQPTAEQLAAYNIDYSKGDIYQITKANIAGTDWFHEVFKNAPMQSHNISAQGGNERSAYFFSLGYYNQQGALLNTYLKRYSVRTNTVFNVKEHIRVGENAYIFYKDNPKITNQSENTIGVTFREQPIIPVYDINGGWAGTRAGGLGNSENPVAQRAAAADDRGHDWQITGNVFAEVDFLRHLTARTSFGGNIDNYYYYFYGFHRYQDAENNTSNSFSENAGYNRSWTWTNTLAYNNIIGNHDIRILAGLEAIENYGRSVGGGALGYFTDNPNFRILSNGSGGFTNYSSVYQSSLYSQFGQISYAYADKYLVSGTIRRDGSSKFGPDARYATFPSVSAGWVVTKESFMQNATWLNNLKLRGSWGKLGNELNVNPLNAFNLFGGGPGTAYYDINGTSTSAVQGFTATRYGNLATGWEKDKLLNFGIDVTVLKNKLDFSVEWYKKSIEGLLFDDQAGALIGGGAVPKVNIGDIENKGFDVSATYHGTVGRDFKFDIGGVLSAYKSKITRIPGGSFDDAFLRIQPLVRNAEGHPIGSFYGYQVIGLFQSADDVAKSPLQDAAAPGRFKYADIDGNDTINSLDRTFIGNPNPDFTYGINISASYKGFDFSMFLYGSKGNDIINYTRYWTDFYPSFQGVKSKDLLYNSWTPDRPNAKTPIAETGSNFSNNGVPNSYYLENGSYLRCKSLLIGYNIPSAQLRKIGVDKFRIYVQAANLFTITKYTGLDPEIAGAVDGNTGQPSNSAFGIDQANYPNIRTFIVGVNLNF
jgi:TonB-linked SusC/RagA family outer membrane protein